VAGGSKQARIHPVPHEGLHITREARGIHGLYVFPTEEKQTGQEGPEKEPSEVDEEDLEYYAKNDFYIPKSVYEGEVQIQMAVRTLDLLMNHKNSASDGYRYGLEFLDGRRNTFHEEQEKDEMFMTRYVSLLDTAFQNFSSELASFHTDLTPSEWPVAAYEGRCPRTSRGS
jgi:hypothetical protein